MHARQELLNCLGLHPTGDLGPLTAYTSKRRKPVWFTKSPPKTPPTPAQRRQRAKFTAAAKAWNALRKETRNAWNTACRRAGLYLHGYTLWIYWQTKRDAPAIRTIEHQSHCALLH